jgi:cytosol alanyl aminopeptidase
MSRSSRLLLAFILSACGGSTQATTSTTATAIPVESSAPDSHGRLDRAVTPRTYTLALRVVPSAAGFSGVADISLNVGHPNFTELFFHAQGLQITAAHVRAHERVFPVTVETVDAREGLTRAQLGEPAPGGEAVLHIEYEAPFDATLEGLYRVNVGEDAYAFTQFEPMSARKAFPCFDEPGWKTPYDVSITYPEGQHAFANTRELETLSAGEGLLTTRFATSEALPTYLVAWAVGPLDAVESTIPPNDVRNAPLTLRGIAPRGRGPELAYALEHTPRIVAALEAYFGIAYPFDKLDLVAVPDFSAGAMENAGLVTFRDSFLLMGADAPVGQRRGFAFVTAHELAHQWFGNLVTMSWWDDLWLNEAFATWMETETVAATFPEMQAEVAEEMTALEAFDADSLATARQIRNPIEASHDVHNAFDSITYSKGASVLQMFESYLGHEVWQRGVQHYLREHARGNATAADLIAAINVESGQDITSAFDSFLTQPGVPSIEVTPSCGDSGATLALRTTRYAPVGSAAEPGRGWQVPFCFRYSGHGEAHTQCTMLTDATASISIPEGCPDWVMPNADGNGYYRFTLEPTWLAKLGARQVLDQLSVREQIAFADSVRAGLDAGRIPFDAALHALEPLTTSTQRFVATAPVSLLNFAHDHVLHSDAESRAFTAYSTRIYRDALRRLGWGPRAGVEEDGETRLLRSAVLTFLALTAKDPAVRREAVRRGRAYLGIGARQNPDQIHPEAIPPDLVDVCLIVAAQEGGQDVFGRLETLFKASEDTVTRGHLLAAMSSVDDADLRTRALQLTLDPQVRLNEVFRPIRGQSQDSEGRAVLFSWLGEHYDALFARIGPAYAGFLPFALSNGCSQAEAEAARTFFEPRVAATEGGPRNLASVLESISLCAAQVESQSAGVHASFAR